MSASNEYVVIVTSPCSAFPQHTMEKNFYLKLHHRYHSERGRRKRTRIVCLCDRVSCICYQNFENHCIDAAIPIESSRLILHDGFGTQIMKVIITINVF